MRREIAREIASLLQAVQVQVDVVLGQLRDVVLDATNRRTRPTGNEDVKFDHAAARNAKPRIGDSGGLNDIGE